MSTCKNLPESVGRMVESMDEQLMDRHAAAAADLLPNATNIVVALPAWHFPDNCYS
jgi:hypothetical protein